MNIKTFVTAACVVLFLGLAGCGNQQGNRNTGNAGGFTGNAVDSSRGNHITNVMNGTTTNPLNGNSSIKATGRGMSNRSDHLGGVNH